MPYRNAKIYENHGLRAKTVEKYTEYNRNWPGGSDVVVLGMRYVEVITALIIIMHIVTVL